jgi:hypothetical protein
MTHLPVPDSVTGRTLPWLSLLGNGDDTTGGIPLTRAQDRLPVHISSSLFRKFTCTEGCYVCCATLSVSLDYIPVETAWLDNRRKSMFEARKLEVNGSMYTVMSNLSKIGDRKKKPERETDPNVLSRFCLFLEPIRNNQPGCSLWKTGSPLACSTSYNMRISEHPDHVQITKQGMGRAWRYDPSPECKFDVVPIEEADIQTNIVLFERLLEWGRYFQISGSEERITQIIFELSEVVRSGVVPPTIIIE